MSGAIFWSTGNNRSWSSTSLKLMHIAHPRRHFTLACRVLCSALVAWPVLYFSLVVEGNAYLFLVLVLLAPLAGIVLVTNSLFCLVRYRRIESFWIGLAFILVGAVGVIEAWYFLPQFHMH